MIYLINSKIRINTESQTDPIDLSGGHLDPGHWSLQRCEVIHFKINWNNMVLLNDLK